MRRIADAKAENDALRDDAAGRRRLHIKAVCQLVREATTASGVDNAALPLTGRHRWTGLFHPQRERPITMQKQLEVSRSILMSSADRCRISMGNSCNYCGSNKVTALPAEYNA